MKLKVNNSELDTFIHTLDEDTKDFIGQIDALLNEVNKLKIAWQGPDATRVCDNAEGYVTFLKTVPRVYGTLSEIMKKANFSYQQLDKDHASNMKKAVVKHE